MYSKLNVRQNVSNSRFLRINLYTLLGTIINKNYNLHNRDTNMYNNIAKGAHWLGVHHGHVGEPLQQSVNTFKVITDCCVCDSIVDRKSVV